MSYIQNILTTLDIFKVPVVMYQNKKQKIKDNDKTTLINQSIRYQGTIYGFICTLFCLSSIAIYTGHLIYEGTILKNFNTYSKITVPNLFNGDHKDFQLKTGQFIN